jgi:hypothetical protein
VAEEALSTGNLTERLRAAEIMLKIGANEKPQGVGCANSAGGMSASVLRRSGR